MHACACISTKDLHTCICGNADPACKKQKTEMDVEQNRRRPLRLIFFFFLSFLCLHFLLFFASSLKGRKEKGIEENGEQKTCTCRRENGIRKTGKWEDVRGLGWYPSNLLLLNRKKLAFFFYERLLFSCFFLILSCALLPSHFPAIAWLLGLLSD